MKRSGIDPRLFVVCAVVAAFGAGWTLRARVTTTVEPRTVASAGTTAAAVAPSAAPAASATAASDPAAMQAAFDAIYAKASWGTNGGDAGASGFGSTMRATALYRAFLAQFMKDTKVTSVVDAGCGDWESTQAIDWSGIDYKGYDIVASVIESDKKRFEKPNVHFFTANIVDTELPAADLLIVKQVLQHLPNAAVAKFLTQLPKYKHVLIMNSVGARSLSADNKAIEAGGFRPLDITRPPFEVPAAKILTYWDGGNMQQLQYVARK
ncbi:MAG: hypothetical protein JWP97_66 [Labilithrix sp.]|nr:hypothetical protein [Labilithrix sp.]